MLVMSDVKQPNFTFERYPRGGYVLYLRENFREYELDGEVKWLYDEYTILTSSSISNSHIEQHFNEYLSEARKKEASDTETRLIAAEDAIAELAEMVGGVQND